MLFLSMRGTGDFNKLPYYTGSTTALTLYTVHPVYILYALSETSPDNIPMAKYVFHHIHHNTQRLQCVRGGV
jgi:hypothetical protein